MPILTEDPEEKILSIKDLEREGSSRLGKGVRGRIYFVVTVRLVAFR